MQKYEQNHSILHLSKYREVVFFTKIFYAKEQALKKEEEKRKKPRQRQRGSDRKATICNIADKLLFILFYFRVYPTQEALGFFYGFGHSHVNKWGHRLTSVLKLPQAIKNSFRLKILLYVVRVLAECPVLVFIIDGTEGPIQGPKDPKAAKKCAMLSRTS